MNAKMAENAPADPSSTFGRSFRVPLFRIRLELTRGGVNFTYGRVRRSRSGSESRIRVLLPRVLAQGSEKRHAMAGSSLKAGALEYPIGPMIR